MNRVNSIKIIISSTIVLGIAVLLFQRIKRQEKPDLEPDSEIYAGRYVRQIQFTKCSNETPIKSKNDLTQLAMNIRCINLIPNFRCDKFAVEANVLNAKNISDKDYEYMEKIGLISPYDGWNRRFWINCSGSTSVICSVGKDGLPDTEDDLIFRCQESPLFAFLEVD